MVFYFLLLSNMRETAQYTIAIMNQSWCVVEDSSKVLTRKDSCLAAQGERGSLIPSGKNDLDPLIVRSNLCCDKRTLGRRSSGRDTGILLHPISEVTNLAPRVYFNLKCHLRFCSSHRYTRTRLGEESVYFFFSFGLLKFDWLTGLKRNRNESLIRLIGKLIDRFPGLNVYMHWK